jgi:uncharacterized protein (DUF2267 family)
MRFTGFEVFDETVQRTNNWLKELMQELNWSDRRKTYVVFRCVLHGLRDHLSVRDAVYVGEQLPMLIRGAYFEHWDPAGKPQPLRSRDEFFSVLAGSLARNGEKEASAETVTRAVFRLLDRKATDGEIANLQAILPPAVTDLWSPALRAA